MKQIKTVIEPISSPKCFDRLINGLLQNGWALKTRTIINSTGELSEAFNAPTACFLYAELEKDLSPFPEEITL